MIDDLLDNKTVKEFIEDIKKSEKYFLKKFDNVHKYQYEVSKEIILFTFYEALFKYKIIIEDDTYLNDYLNDLDRLFRKIINYHDIADGINKLICKAVANKLCIARMTTPEAREEIILYIFNKYYNEGYLYHGFSTVYEEDLKDKDFVPGVYNNQYDKMIEIEEIYKKYNDVAFNKDFSDLQIYFTDNFVDACYYSLYSPKYLYKYLLEEHDKGNNKIYLNDDFDICIINVKKYVDKEFDTNDAKKVIDNLKAEWKLLNGVNRRVSLIVVKRNLIEKVDDKLLDKYLKSDESLYEIVDRILGSTNKTVGYSDVLNKDDYNIFSLDYKDKVVKKEMTVEKIKKEADEEKISVTQDISGYVTCFMLLGSLFISSGVIITVAMLLGGN